MAHWTEENKTAGAPVFCSRLELLDFWFGDVFVCSVAQSIVSLSGKDQQIVT